MSWQTFKLQHSTHSDQHREGQKTFPENLLGLNKVQLLHTGHQGSLQSAGKINKNLWICLGGSILGDPKSFWTVMINVSEI